MKVLFVMDPIKNLNPKSDSSLRIAREFQSRGIEVYATTFDNLSWQTHELFAEAERLEKFGVEELPQFKSKGVQNIKSFGIVLIRKDPPFDKSYVNLCWLLAAYEPEIVVSNPASKLLRHHEKMIPLEAVREGYLKKSDLIPTLISQNRETIRQFVDSLSTDEIILKPFYGFAGHEIRKVGREHFLKAPHDYLSDSKDLMVQPFLSEIRTEGDRRVFIVGGKVRGDFVRLPQGTSIISNLARGGRAELRTLSGAQKKVLKRVEQYIRHLKIDFAGVDLIGTKVSEINITSPTGLIAYEKLSGVNVAKTIVDALLKRSRK